MSDKAGRDDFIKPGPMVEGAHPAVIAFAADAVGRASGDAGTDKEKAIRLY